MDLIKKKLEEIIGRVFGIEAEVEVGLAPELESTKGVGVAESGDVGLEVAQPDFASNVAMKINGEVNRKLAAGEISKEVFGEASEGTKKVSPREVAEVLKQEFLKSMADELPEAEFKVEVAGPGFLNFTPGDGFYFKNIEDFGADLENFEKKISPDEYKGKTVVTEFSDPNPFKVLHVGHLYTSVVGDAISRLIEVAGGRVYRVNFGGDVGLHVAKTIYSLACGRKSVLEARPERPSLRGSGANPRRNSGPSSNGAFSPLAFTIEDIAKAYVEGTRAYEDDEGAKGEIVRLNKLIYKIAEKGEGKFEGLDEEERKVAEIYWRGRELSYQYFKDFYKEIGVKFDKFYPESTVAKTGLEKVKENLGKVYQESDGAVVFRGEEFGLHTRVFVNKEGLPTYEAKDVGLLFRKWADYKFDESVVITGNDIVDYMKVVLKSVEQYAPELVEKTRHITHGNMRLPGDEKMSSRKGNFVKAVDVINMIKDKFEKPDEKIVLGAIKYFFLKYKIGGNIVFDAEESVSLNGNSGPYLQYSVVRAKKILLACSSKEACADISSRDRTSRPPAVAGVARPMLSPVGSENSLEETVGTASPLAGRSLNVFERKLNKKFVQYPEVLRGAVREKAPHLVANYLFELAQEFSRFYENCQVRGSEAEAERKKFVQVFIKIMEHGLGILGISVPEEM